MMCTAITVTKRLAFVTCYLCFFTACTKPFQTRAENTKKEVSGSLEPSPVGSSADTSSPSVNEPTVTVPSPSVTGTSPAFDTGGAVSAKKSNYTTYVNHAGATSGFKSLQQPNTLQTRDLGTSYQVKYIFYQIPDTAPEKLKFFLPPGTVGFDAGMFYFLANDEGKGVIRFNSPPETALSSNDPLNVYTTENLGGPTGRAYDETILLNLIANKEVRYYSEGRSANYMVLSSPANVIKPMATGGYVYGNFQYPGGRLQRAEWKVYVKADCYDQWFNSPTTKWDNLGNPDENAIHTCTGSATGTAQ